MLKGMHKETKVNNQQQKDYEINQVIYRNADAFSKYNGNGSAGVKREQPSASYTGADGRYAVAESG